MSNYPVYPDFGKSTKDFFTKGFKVGEYKLNVRSNPSKWINAVMSGTHEMEKNEAHGDCSVSLTCPRMPEVTTTTKWDTKNLITQSVVAKDLLAPGAEVGVEGTYNGESAALGGKAHGIYKHQQFTLDANVEGGGDGENTNPLVGASIVTGHKDFAAGYQFQVDAKEGALVKNNVSLAYVKGPISFLTSLDNLELLWTGLIYRHNPYIEGGLTATYKSEPEGFSVFGTALKYMMDCCNAVKAKVDSDKKIYIGYETKIRPTSTITMSVEVDGNKLSEGGHKVGLAFDLEC